MNEFRAKIRLVYFPFLLIAVCFVGLYTLLNWQLIIVLHIVDIDEQVVNLWLPIILSWVPCFIWLWPRLRKLQYANNRQSAFVLLFSTAFTIGVSAMCAQKYLSTATGKLTTLQYINEIQERPPTKYYELKEGYISKTNTGIAYTKRTRGKYQQYLDIFVYAVLPIYRTPADTMRKECSFWLAKKYQKTIGNRLAAAEKERLFRIFFAEAKQNLASTDFPIFTFLERIGHTGDHKIFNDAITKSGLVTYQDPVLLEMHSELFSKRNGNAFIWIFASFGIGAAFFFLLLLSPKIKASTTAE